MGTVLWDFDGTLAKRSSATGYGQWFGCFIEVATEAGLHVLEHDRVRAHFQAGFPWHAPESAREPCEDADAWWSGLVPLEAAFRSVGAAEPDLADLRARFRRAYLDCTRWEVFEDTVPSLERLAQAGWSHAIVSNHVPELDEIVQGLGLDRFFSRIFTSARTGYEKPHPDAYRTAMGALGDGALWMIGDNPIADVEGAEAVGIPAILVRAQAPCERVAPDLDAAVGIILSVTPSP